MKLKIKVAIESKDRDELLGMMREICDIAESALDDNRSGRNAIIRRNRALMKIQQIAGDAEGGVEIER